MPRFARDPRCAGRIIEGRAALVTGHDNKLHLLNPTGTTIWRRAESECSFDDLVEALVAEFEVDTATARRDIETFCADLLDRRILVQRSAEAAP
jgi:hypothetical protein